VAKWPESSALTLARSKSQRCFAHWLGNHICDVTCANTLNSQSYAFSSNVVNATETSAFSTQLAATTLHCCAFAVMLFAYRHTHCASRALQSSDRITLHLHVFSSQLCVKWCDRLERSETLKFWKFAIWRWFFQMSNSISIKSLVAVSSFLIIWFCLRF